MPIDAKKKKKFFFLDFFLARCVIVGFFAIFLRGLPIESIARVNDSIIVGKKLKGTNTQNTATIIRSFFLSLASLAVVMAVFRSCDGSV